MKLPCWIALGTVLLLLDTAAAFRWPRNSEEQPPTYLEASGSNPFYDDEDLYSGSGSGFPDIDFKTRTKLTFTTEVPVPLSTTQATSLAPSVPPAAMPTGTQSVPGVEKESRAPATESVRRQPSPAASIPMATTSSVTTTAQKTPPTTSLVDFSSTVEEKEDVFIPVDSTEEATTVLPTVEPTTAATTTTTTTTAAPRRKTASTTTTTAAASTAATTTTLAPTTTTTMTATTTQAPTPAATVRPRAAKTTTQLPGIQIQTELTTTGLLFTSVSKTQTPEETLNNEVGGAGNSGDFEIREEETNNEVPRDKPKTPTDKMEPDLLGNTIDTGSSAAQLPQKNILERKEVLIAVIVGGVVGALFAAFLVMLLVYRMKKKDEGSYTLEEPKQATVTYQKPDKQEEFYA
ncbi:syndecan-3 [Amia ocellicauda]|uniref:syndecan-3 n=1 Tax=Amia ocellicauda TaxID=2972642 RepID=UPI0034647A26